MSDKKTSFRELSFAISMGLFIKEIPFDFESLTNSKKFNDYLRLLSFYKNGELYTTNQDDFTEEIIEIIRNGFLLAEQVYKSSFFEFDRTDSVLWVAEDTQKNDPIDVIVGKYPFSLKENSYILQNMGLYSFLNCMTNSNYEKGLHIFNDFAHESYEEWFMYVWESFVKFIEEKQYWNATDAYISEAQNYSDKIQMRYDDTDSCYIPKGISSFEEYMKFTTSNVREKVFSKWIHSYLNEDFRYTLLKRTCAMIAGNNVSKFIKDNFKYENLSNFFYFCDREYYYAKVTSNEGAHVYLVPSVKNIRDDVKFIECTFSVPESQLNICTTFENIKTKKRFSFRNECRFSHGQFNGTPEAKLYFDKNSSLSDLYEPIF